MATSGQFSGTGTGKDPRASTAIPGTSKPSAPQRPGGGGGGISPGKLIVAGGVFLVLLVLANVVFLVWQKEGVKAEQEFEKSAKDTELISKMTELESQIGQMKALIDSKNKDMERLRLDLKNVQSQVQFLTSRDMR